MQQRILSALTYLILFVSTPAGSISMLQLVRITPLPSLHLALGLLNFSTLDQN